MKKFQYCAVAILLISIITSLFMNEYLKANASSTISGLNNNFTQINFGTIIEFKEYVSQKKKILQIDPNEQLVSNDEEALSVEVPYKFAFNDNGRYLPVEDVVIQWKGDLIWTVLLQAEYITEEYRDKKIEQYEQWEDINFYKYLVYNN